MKITKKDWQNYIARLRRVNEKAAEKVAEYMKNHDYSSAEGMKALLEYSYAVATQYGEAASELACQMYDAVAVGSNARVPSAEPASTASFGEIARAIRGKMFDTSDPAAVGSAVGKLVKMAGVDTTMQNALRDGAEWAWIPSGDTCAFCIMLASNGWQRASKDAIKNGHAEHIHPNCDCTYQIRFDGMLSVEGYDPDALYNEYVGSGETRQERLNAIRRKLYAKNPEYYREQNRQSYYRRKLRLHFNRAKDVTKDYLDTATPRSGLISFEKRVDKHKSRDEVAMAKWLHDNLGGDITVLSEKYTENVKSPDFLWMDQLWDLKTTSTEKSANSAIRSGMKQIRDNPGGIILNFGNNEISMDALKRVLDARMQWYPKGSADIMIISKGKLIMVLRY